MSVTEKTDPATEIRSLAEAAGVPEATATFAVESLYPEVNIDGGYAKRGVPAAVYAAVRIRGDPIKPREIADHVDDDVGPRRIMGDAKRMLSGLPFDVTVDGVEADFVARYCRELGVDDSVAGRADALCADAVDAGLNSGRAPSAFAAAVVYAAVVVEDAEVEQKQVAEVADVTTTIIRRYYRDIIAASSDSSTATHRDIPNIVDRVVAGIDGDIPEAVRSDAVDMATAIDPEVDWVRRCNPKAIGAAIVYVAAKRHRLDVTQAEVGEPVGISRHAVNARSQDVKRWDTRRRFDDMSYNELKAVAADHAVDVGQTPERDYLVDSLVDAGVSP